MSATATQHQHQGILEPNNRQGTSYHSTARLLKPLYLTEHTQTSTRSTPTRAPSLNLQSQFTLHSISPLNSYSFTPTSTTRSRRSAINSKLSRSSSVSVLRPFIHQHAFSRSMSLTHSPELTSPPSIDQDHQMLNNIRNSKPLNNQPRSTIPYSKSNSIFIPPTNPHHHHRSESNRSSNLSHSLCQSPSGSHSSDIDSELDSLLASMIDCAKSFGIQDELNGIVDI